MKLAARALSASGWVIGGYGAAQVLRFGSNLVMTRLLAPEMFGVMALALTFMFALQMFSDVGLTQVAIQHRRGAERRFLDVLWTVQVLRGALLMVVGLLLIGALVAAVAAGWLPEESVYAHPDLPGVLAMLAFSALVGGFASTQLISQGRQLNLRQTILLGIWAQVVGFIAMMAWAAYDRSVYALAVGSVVSAAFTSIVSHIWLPGERDRFAWDPEVWTEIWRFGRWVALSSVLGFFVLSGDRLLLSAYLSAAEFGLYAIAIMIVQIVHDLCGRLGGMVGLPALSEVNRERPHDLRRVYYRFGLPLFAFGYGSLGFLLMAGTPVIEFLYDDRYSGAGPILQILALTLLIVGTTASGNLFMAIGKTWMITLMQCIRLVTLVVALPVLASLYGFQGAVYGVVLSYAVALVPSLIFQFRIGLLDLWREIGMLGFIALGALAGWPLRVWLAPA